MVALAFGIGTQELILIAVLILVLFGAAKLPQLGSSVGQSIRNFKRGMREVKAEEEEEAKKAAERRAIEDKSDDQASSAQVAQKETTQDKG